MPSSFEPSPGHAAGDGPPPAIVAPPAASLTALRAAAGRAAHLLVDAEPRIYVDPLAEPLLGDRAEELLDYHRAHGAHPLLAAVRAQVVCRARFSADRLAEAVSRGVDQYVVLGAGLDSSGYRRAVPGPPTSGGAHGSPDGSPPGPGGDPSQDRAGRPGELHVFEVDQPASQAWKLQALAGAGIVVPPLTRHVPVDLERQDLRAALTACGFDPCRPAFVSWLGCTMYLTREAVERTLATVAALAPGSELVADHLVPERLRDDAGRQYAEQVAAVAAEEGEPWLTFLDPDEVPALLARHGLDCVARVSQADAVPARLWRRSDALRPNRLQALLHARVPASAGWGG